MMMTCAKKFAASRRLVFRVRRDVATPDVLDGDVPDVEPDVVSRLRLGERLVLGLNRPALRPKAARRKPDHLAWLQDTRLNTANRDGPNPRDLVDVMRKKTQRLLNRPDRLMDLSSASRNLVPLYHGMFFDRSIMLSPLRPEMGTTKSCHG